MIEKQNEQAGYTPKSEEQRIRRRLGIPDDAEQVLIFSESSHWDPDWLLTSEEYFERFVRHNLDFAIEELKKETRRVYSIECIFFLRLYWERYPSCQNSIRELVNNGRLRLTSSGITTADTLLPGTESILRDFLIGQEWLRANGMNQEPKLAYFADSFGCTPALPSLLKASGFDFTAITRVDGMYFMGCDLEPSRRFPKPGSTAECLLNLERSLDFIWRDQNGAQVLCHWNAFTYGMGDMLAFNGFSRVYLFRVAFSSRSGRHIARRINQYAGKLSPVSRTPYMLCPIGFDFVEPIPGLVALLDRYNQNYYPKTGIWAVNAGMDDYLELVNHYKDKLPVLELDPNPYWTGFYTSRPVLKQRCRNLVDNLLLAEKLSFLPDNGIVNKTISEKLEDAWLQAVVSNHHDFITGTSPDKIVKKEQMPWLLNAIKSVDSIVNCLKSILPETAADKKHSGNLEWSRKNGKIHIKSNYYEIELSEDAGGAITTMRSNYMSKPCLSSLSNELVSYRDSGGLWRMGLEFAGGIWKESASSGNVPSHMQVVENDVGLEIISSSNLNGALISHRMSFISDSPVIYCSVEGIAPKGHSVTVRLKTGIHSKNIAMDTPGGTVTRPLKRIYSPTFWPLYSFSHIRDNTTGHGLAVLQPLPGAITCQADGNLELVAMRNATREKVFGLIGIPGNPAKGSEYENYTFDYAFLFTQKGGWRENNIHIKARNIKRNPWNNYRDTFMSDLADSIITVDSADVWVSAVKPASRGEGIIVRLTSFFLIEKPVMLTSAHYSVKKAFLCDVREHDLQSLGVANNIVTLTMPGTIVTIRLLTEQTDKKQG